MPVMKVVQIGPLYHQLKAFPQILTLTIVKFGRKFEKGKITEKTRYRATSYTIPPTLLLMKFHQNQIGRLDYLLY